MSGQRPPHGALQPRGALARAAFALAVVLSVVVLFAPGPDVPTAPPGTDKVVHLLLFAVLGLTACWAGLVRTAAAVLLVGYAALSEVIQGVTALDRSASVADWLADVAGVLLGLLAWRRLSARRSARGPTA